MRNLKGDVHLNAYTLRAPTGETPFCRRWSNEEPTFSHTYPPQWWYTKVVLSYVIFRDSGVPIGTPRVETEGCDLNAAHSVHHYSLVQSKPSNLGPLQGHLQGPGRFDLPCARRPHGSVDRWPDTEAAGFSLSSFACCWPCHSQPDYAARREKASTHEKPGRDRIRRPASAVAPQLRTRGPVRKVDSRSGLLRSQGPHKTREVLALLSNQGEVIAYD